MKVLKLNNWCVGIGKSLSAEADWCVYRPSPEKGDGVGTFRENGRTREGKEVLPFILSSREHPIIQKVIDPKVNNPLVTGGVSIKRGVVTLIK